MAKVLSDINSMQMIYDVSKDVYDGKYSAEFGIDYLKDEIDSSPSSIKMYFAIYAAMRNGKCYKMGTGKPFTKFLLNSILSDFGLEVYMLALKAVKGNNAYRKSVNNAQPGIVEACKESISENSLDINFDEIEAASYETSNDSDLTEDGSIYAGVHISGGIPSFDTVPADSSSQSSIVKVDNDSFELNIQPAASILNVFSRLSYKPWYAIAEFVDNSTQSFISHATELSSLPEFDKLIVTVKYDEKKNTLTITDNAYGMELDRFRDAILLDSRNETQSGRNEFGMGLKTAASWFGNVWCVTSTQYGSNNRYTAVVDIPKLKEQNLNSIKIHKDFAEKKTHGTEIIIEQITKKITGSRTVGKIRELLSSMYRRDINNRNIEIWFNDEPIVFEEYPVLTNFRGKSWKKDLDFDVEFLDKKYNVTGFVAIMDPGSFPKAGFALFRQDRVVVGGSDANYKPSQIFGQAQSQRSLKLFGELNMNDFPVNQAKDGFIWDDGLEDAFIDALKNNIQEYIEIAELSKKERNDETQFSDQASDELQQDVENVINKAFSEEKSEEEDNQEQTNEQSKNSNQDDYHEYIDTILHAETVDSVISTKREYDIPLTPIITVHFSVQWAKGSKKYWIEYSEIENDKYEVKINIDHPFFMPFTKEDGFQKVLEKFTLSFILAERQAKLGSSKDGYIPCNVIKNYMNSYLEKLAEDI